MKLTKPYLQSLIARTEYHRVPETTTTVCTLILHNGFTVTGTSACINAADFDEQIGRETAHQNAFEKLWELEGYRIKAETEPLEKTWQGRLLLEYRQLQERTEKLYAFLNANSDHETAAILCEQYYLMHEYLAVLQKRVAALDEPVMPLPGSKNEGKFHYLQRVRINDKSDRKELVGREAVVELVVSDELMVRCQCRINDSLIWFDGSQLDAITDDTAD